MFSQRIKLCLCLIAASYLLYLSNLEMIKTRAWNLLRLDTNLIDTERITVQQMVRRPMDMESKIWKKEECIQYWEELFRNFTVYTNAIAPSSGLQMQDVAIITHVTPDRMHTLYRQYEHWRAPLTCVIYLEENEMLNTTKQLNQWLDSLQEKHHLTVHYTIKTGDIFPANLLKNLAQDIVPAEYVIYLDTDLVPSKHLLKAVRREIQSGVLASHEKRILAIPAFDVLDIMDLPYTKEDVVENFDKTVRPFTFGTPRDFHKATDFPKWLETKEAYKVDYINKFEPFLVIRKSESPQYMNYFQDRWRVKVTHVHNIAARCFEFWVLPDGFLTHVHHSTNHSVFSKSIMKCAINLSGVEFEPYLKLESQKYCPTERTLDEDIPLKH